MSDDANLHFEDALYLLKGGAFVSRRGWKRAGAHLFLVPADEVTYHPRIFIRHSDGSERLWGPTQFELFATDWVLVEATGD